ncbi:hypothetical protein G436_1744 [Leptospira interrogans serovar Hardjo str. Norma]|uniref:Uncharacterized protein n=1 Tax=Leptospira interrogans serovar Hardjo str. Norma TaxID=1279460 RepID=A0A0M3TLE1_LEPIR|nr:hypothetical protein G436_1744 [Leptospira interrogans serovar Hardjo str. Norma]
MLSANFLKKEKMGFGTLINVSLVMICFSEKSRDWNFRDRFLKCGSYHILQ